MIGGWSMVVDWDCIGGIHIQKILSKVLDRSRLYVVDGCCCCCCNFGM